MGKTSEKLFAILSHGGFRRYFANTSWLMIEKIFRMIVTLTVGVYVVRYLGPERFGLLSYAMSFVALFSAFSTLGLDNIIVRELVDVLDEQDKLLGTAFILKVIGSLVVFVALAVALLFMNNDGFTNLLVMVIAASLLFQSFNVIQFYFEAEVLSKYFVISQLVALIIISIVKLVFIYMKLPLFWFALTVAVESIFLATGLLIFYSKQSHSPFRWGFSFGLAVRLLKDSWPLILSGIVISIYMRIDQVMIKQMLDDDAVGQYAAAVRLSEAWYFIPMVICSSLFPAVLNAKKRSRELYYTRLQRLYGLMLWISLPVALIITFNANNIVRFLFGAEFSQTGSVLTVHIWAGVFVFLGVASSKWYLAENLQRFSSINTFVGAIVNVVLNLVLITRMGIMGAAWATVVSQILASYLMNCVYKKTRNNFYRLSQSFNLFKILGRKRFPRNSYY